MDIGHETLNKFIKTALYVNREVLKSSPNNLPLETGNTINKFTINSTLINVN